MRDPQGTRQKLLTFAAGEIHRHGFQAASLDRILTSAGVTKGALYYHFPNKAALGKAVVDEVFRSWALDHWIRPLEKTGDPIDAIKRQLNSTASSATPEVVELGCPLNNMAQEMSLVDEEFRRCVCGTFDLWREGLASALRRGQSAGYVRPDIDPDAVATFLVAAAEGSIGMAKNAKSLAMLRSSLGHLIAYVETLRTSSESEAAQLT